MVSCISVDRDKLASVEISPKIYSFGLGVFILDSGDIWEYCLIAWTVGFVGRPLERRIQPNLIKYRLELIL